MLDVVRLDEERMIAAREAARALAHVQRTQQWLRHGATAATDVEHVAVAVGLGGDEPGVAGDALEGFATDGGAVV